MMLAPLLLIVGPWLREAPTASQVAYAASNGIEDNPLLFILNFGVLGVWVFANATGLQPTRGEVRILQTQIESLQEDAKRRDEKDRAKDDAVGQLIALMTNRTLPALASAVSEVPQVAAQAAQHETALGKRLEDALARVERVLGDERST